MKKTYLLLLLITLFYSCLSFAQTEKGKYLIGANSNMKFSSLTTTVKDNNRSEDIQRTNTFEFSPSVGCFVANNFVIGFEIPFTYKSEKYSSLYNPDVSKETSSTLSFSPFARYYFDLNKTVKPFLQGQIGIGRSNNTAYFRENSFNNNYQFDPYENSTYSSFEYKSNLFMYGIGGGIAVFLNDKISLDFEIGYVSISLTPDDPNYSDEIVSHGFGSSVGFSYFF